MLYPHFNEVVMRFRAARLLARSRYGVSNQEKSSSLQERLPSGESQCGIGLVPPKGNCGCLLGDLAMPSPFSSPIPEIYRKSSGPHINTWSLEVEASHYWPLFLSKLDSCQKVPFLQKDFHDYFHPRHTGDCVLPSPTPTPTRVLPACDTLLAC